MPSSPEAAGRGSPLAFDTSLPRIRRAADSLMLSVCGLCALVALAVGWHFEQLALAAGMTLALSAMVVLLYLLWKGTWFSSLGFPMLLLSFIALHIQLAGGKIEYHFGVFVALAFLLAYRHWLPVLIGGLTVAVHHVLFDRLQAMGFPVFCLPIPDFFTVVLHAAFVVAEVAFGMLVAMRMNRDALLSAELEHITEGLSAASGQVSYAQLGMSARTPAGAQLLEALGTIRDATLVAHRSVTLVDASTSEIASGSANLSARTTQAASELQRTASAVQQLTASVSATADSARQASQLADMAARLAGGGEIAAEKLTQRMGVLADSSRKVADITGVIDSIAFQTNILALNAAVEAARAGEQGRGFAVVASEVRQLAQRSASAAAEIRKLVEESTSLVESSFAATRETRDGLSAILSGIQRVDGLLAEVSRAAAEQHGGVAGVNESLTLLGHVTQQNAALVEEFSAAASTLREQSAHLARAMGTFEFA